jgi:hypothetical protein
VTVRYLAQELYRLTRRLEELEGQLAALAPGSDLKERQRLEAELLKVRKDRDQVRAVLEAKKEKPLV